MISETKALAAPLVLNKKSQSDSDQVFEQQRNSFSTQASTFAGDRWSTLQGFDYLTTERIRQSTLPTLDRMDQEEPQVLIENALSANNSFVESQNLRDTASFSNNPNSMLATQNLK